LKGLGGGQTSDISSSHLASHHVVKEELLHLLLHSSLVSTLREYLGLRHQQKERERERSHQHHSSKIKPTIPTFPFTIAPL